jgi:hypothetical protein
MLALRIDARLMPKEEIIAQMTKDTLTDREKDEQKAKEERTHKLEKNAAVTRELLRHESDLLNHRMAWLVQSQGLLFAALAFSWDKEPRLPILLATLGIMSAISLGMATSLMSDANKQIHDWWKSETPEEEQQHYRVIGLWEPKTGFRRMMRPWRALPVIFAVAWVGVIILRITK